MKKMSMLNLKPSQNYLEISKKYSSFDLMAKSPYRSSFGNQKFRNPPKEYKSSKLDSGSMKSPLSKKGSKPISISHASSHKLQQIVYDIQSPGRFQGGDSSRRPSKNTHISQLRNLLIKEKQSPIDLTQRFPTQVTSHHFSNSPKKNLKTSPDTRINENLKNRVPVKKVQKNISERMLQLEQTKSKIMALQNKIQNRIQVRSPKSNTQNFFQSELHLPQPSNIVVEKFSSQLTEYERKEILEFENIYFIGQKCNKNDVHQFDFENGDYKFQKGDHIAYRYELIDKLGHGSFGCVFKVHDHKHKQLMALKMIKNKEKFHNQALVEIEILRTVNKADSTSCLVRMLNYFEFRNHICIVFELMSCNLYEFIAINEFKGFDLDLIRRFAIQILQALLYLKEFNIIHCDLKPENILLKEFNRSGIRVIDFGSSCFQNQKMYTYIQSRFYRAPEIVLGYPYTTQIDMWSFGCIVAELFTGQSLFQSKSEGELLYLQTKVIGKPPNYYIEQSGRKDKFFDKDNQLIYKPSDLDILLQIKPLKQMLANSSDSFYDFVQKCLNWNAEYRLTPEQALIHPWILEGLPDSIKKQHLNQMKSIRGQQGQGEQQEII